MENVKTIAQKYPPVVQAIKYGTAGFRTKASVLEPVLFRMGLLAVLRSKIKHATIGVMVTASHNPEEDNGVKLVDPMGDMLEQSWEEYATILANASSDDVPSVLEKLVADLSIDLSVDAHVAYARDTRASGPALIAALADGINALQGTSEDFGIATTPQLHYVIRCINTKGDYGESTLSGYYEKLAPAFLHLYHSSGATQPISLTLDCANGVGAISFINLIDYIGSVFNVNIVNDSSNGKLNYQCGADFVKVDQKVPINIEIKEGLKCASFDGDADRLIYFSQLNNSFFMLDGDRIAILMAEFINELLTRVGLNLNIGLVQTAYANGGATRYVIDKLHLPVTCAKTGVKFLHHAAQEYDVGVYFEANGHGTVLFSDHALQAIQQLRSESGNKQQEDDIANLRALVALINQTVGDAISDLLVVEVILLHKKITVLDWVKSYDDLPNRQLKVSVPDRNVITTTDAERIVVTPEGLQNDIDFIVKKYPLARSFVRPSGTEDVVRVYAESNTRENTELLAVEIADAVKKHVSRA